MYVFVCFRKELVDNGDLSVTEDLKFGGLVLKKHPKSPETFSHRLDDLDHTICCYDLCQYWWEMTSLSSYCKISVPVLLMCLVNHNMYRFLGRLGNCVIILEMLKFRKLNDKSNSLIQFSGGFVQVFEFKYYFKQLLLYTLHIYKIKDNFYLYFNGIWIEREFCYISFYIGSGCSIDSLTTV